MARYFDEDLAQYVDAGSQAWAQPGAGSFTVGGWFKLDRIGTRVGIGRWTVTQSVLLPLYVLHVGTSQMSFSVASGPLSYTFARVDGPFTPGAWYHLCGMRDVASSALRLFVGGLELGPSLDVSIQDLNLGSPLSLRLGYDVANLLFWPGAIDDVFIRKNVCSLSQIRAMARGMSPLRVLGPTDLAYCPLTSIEGEAEMISGYDLTLTHEPQVQGADGYPTPTPDGANVVAHSRFLKNRRSSM